MANVSHRGLYGSAVFTLESPDNTTHYLWVDDSGNWRTADTLPADRNGEGTVVGPPAYQNPFVVNVTDYGAIGDGIADDTAAIQAAIDDTKGNGFGGTIRFPPGVYRTRATLLVDGSDITLLGDGAEIFFDPATPIVGGTNDRAFYIHLGDDIPSDYSTERDINGSIAIGATSFSVAFAGDASDLVAGDWLTLSEIDTGVDPDEIVFFDWVQVFSVVGTTVNVMAPFRTAFPATHATVKFRKINTLVRNVVIRDLRIRTTNDVNALPLIVVGMVREVTLENLTLTCARGNGFASYRTADLVVKNCHQRSNFAQATEIAATVGLSVTDCTFATYDVQSTGAQLVLDYGTAFFRVSGNRIGPSGNIACQIIYGCHDGIFDANVIDYVRDAGLGYTLGLLVQGCERIVIARNILIGGSGGAAEGITLANADSFVPPLVSVDNIVVDNIVKNFSNPYGAYVGNDLFRILTSLTTDLAHPLRLRSTLAVDTNATLGNDPASRTHVVNGKLTVNAAAGGQCLVVKGATNGLTDGVAKVTSNRTGWGDITAQLKTTAGGSTATDKLDVSIDSGGINLSTGGKADALVMSHAGRATFGASLALANEIAPAQLTANQNDYNPTGFSDATHVLLTSDASRDVTGFANPANGRLLWVYNNGAQNIVLRHQSASSTATNRIIGRGGADTTLTPNTGAQLYYSPSLTRWVVMGDTL